MRAGRLSKPDTPMRAGIPPAPQRVSFSFRHIARDHDKFSYSAKASEYFCKVLERLSALSDLSIKELHASRSPSLRMHPIEWEGTSEPEGFAHLNEQLRASTPYQFSISGNAHGRVHGFVVDHVFYVVWLDPDHRLYL